LRRFAGAASASLLLCACAGRDRPDIVLISLDSVRGDALTFDDPEGAERLTKLAREGTVFTQAVSGSSWTLPAHAQMFTGQPPVLHGVQYDDIAIDPLLPTVPEVLQANGWFTAGFWTGWYLAGEYGFERGFDVYENAMTGGAELERQYEQAVENGDMARAERVLGGRDVMSHQDVTSLGVADRIRATLARLGSDQSLFLFAHFFDPHYDYVPPSPWDTSFDPDYRGDYDGRNFYRNPRIFDGERRRIPERDLQHIYALYRGEIGWTDSVIGLVLDQLEASGRLDETLVVVTSDHGDEFFDHGARGHRHSLFEELIHVPLMVRLPASMRTGVVSRVDRLVSLSDLAPTLLSTVGLPVPPTVVGRSLLPLVAGQSLPARPLVSTLAIPGGDGGGVRVSHLIDGIRTERFKLLRRMAIDSGAPRPHVIDSVAYDIASDPREARPILDPTDPRVVEAAALLDRELEQLRARWNAQENSPPARRATRIRELFRGDLAALGYVVDDEDPAAVESPGFALPWGVGPHPPPAPRPADGR
jgi:arylsulfatase A-like enzyme